MRFGQGPLSTPLLVETIETYFVPLCIYNNTKDDAPWLEKYSEPSWNNPVFRFFDADGNELLQRKDGVWGSAGLASRMAEAITKSGKDAPRWLTLLASELDTPSHERATIAMFCFWEGERRLGNLDGVVSTEAAWMGGQEVVDIVFDPKAVEFGELLSTAKELKCLHNVYAHSKAQFRAAHKARIKVARADPSTHRAAKPSDRKYYLTKMPMRFVPLTPSQATKANAAIGLKQDPTPFLSPRQLALLKRIVAALKKDPTALDGLQRPAALDGLATYETALRARLR